MPETLKTEIEKTRPITETTEYDKKRGRKNVFENGHVTDKSVFYGEQDVVINEAYDEDPNFYQNIPEAKLSYAYSLLEKRLEQKKSRRIERDYREAAEPDEAKPGEVNLTMKDIVELSQQIAQDLLPDSDNLPRGRSGLQEYLRIKGGQPEHRVLLMGYLLEKFLQKKPEARSKYDALVLPSNEDGTEAFLTVKREREGKTFYLIIAPPEVTQPTRLEELPRDLQEKFRETLGKSAAVETATERGEDEIVEDLIDALGKVGNADPTQLRKSSERFGAREVIFFNATELFKKTHGQDFDPDSPSQASLAGHAELKALMNKLNIDWEGWTRVQEAPADKVVFSSPFAQAEPVERLQKNAEREQAAAQRAAEIRRQLEQPPAPAEHQPRSIPSIKEEIVRHYKNTTPSHEQVIQYIEANEQELRANLGEKKAQNLEQRHGIRFAEALAQEIASGVVLFGQETSTKEERYYTEQREKQAEDLIKKIASRLKPQAEQRPPEQREELVRAAAPQIQAAIPQDFRLQQKGDQTPEDQIVNIIKNDWGEDYFKPGKKRWFRFGR